MNVPALLTTATREVALMTRPGRGCLGEFRRVDHDNLRRGVRYRIVVPDAARTGHAATRLRALALAGADVRTVPEIPADALVIDGAIVALPVDNPVGTGEGGAAIFHLPSVVATTAELFERVWFTAVPITPAAPATADLGSRERALLSLLLAGSTDETAAARLGISVRTVRRTVAAAGWSNTPAEPPADPILTATARGAANLHAGQRVRGEACDARAGSSRSPRSACCWPAAARGSRGCPWPRRRQPRAATRGSSSGTSPS